MKEIVLAKKGQLFCLTTPTAGVRVEDGKPATTVEIPRDSVIEIVSGVEDPHKLIEVDWHGLRVMVFAQDVRDRGQFVGQLFET